MSSSSGASEAGPDSSIFGGESVGGTGSPSSSPSSSSSSGSSAAHAEPERVVPGARGAPPLSTASETSEALREATAGIPMALRGPTTRLNLGRMSELVLCHSCGDQTVGLLRTDGEYSCRSCLSTFVELVHENIPRDIPPLAGIDAQVLNARLGVSAPQREASRAEMQSATTRQTLAGHTGPAASAALERTTSALQQQLLANVEGILRQAAWTGSAGGGPGPLSAQGPGLAAAGGGGAVGGVGVYSIPPIQPIVGVSDSIARAPVNHQPPLDLVSSFLGNGYAGGDLSRASVVSLLHQILVQGMDIGGAAGLGRSSGAPPAPASAIAGLERITVTEENCSSLGSSGECYISQAPFEVGEMCVNLACNHAFKEEAIVRWLGMHGTCPVCRAPIVPVSDEIDPALSGSSFDDLPPLVESDSVYGDYGEDDLDLYDDSDGPPPLIDGSLLGPPPLVTPLRQTVGEDGGGLGAGSGVGGGLLSSEPSPHTDFPTSSFVSSASRHVPIVPILPYVQPLLPTVNRLGPLTAALLSEPASAAVPAPAPAPASASAPVTASALPRPPGPTTVARVPAGDLFADMPGLVDGSDDEAW